MDINNVVIVSKQTDWEKLLLRHCHEEGVAMALGDTTRFKALQTEHEMQQAALNDIRASLDSESSVDEIQIDRLRHYPWAANTLIICTGPDGLFANVAKYVPQLPNVAVLCANPNKALVAGKLMRHDPKQAGKYLKKLRVDNVGFAPMPILQANFIVSGVEDPSLRLLAVNDFFIGRSNHSSAMYDIEYASRKETQISSGVIIAGPIGGTGWVQSVTGANPFSSWFADYDYFCVREPFPSVGTGTGIRQGELSKTRKLTIRSNMAENGIVCSDGMLEHTRPFKTGTCVEFSRAKHQINYIA
jgi:NAD kinase